MVSTGTASCSSGAGGCLSVSPACELHHLDLGVILSQGRAPSLSCVGGKAFRLLSSSPNSPEIAELTLCLLPQVVMDQSTRLPSGDARKGEGGPALGNGALQGAEQEFTVPTTDTNLRQSQETTPGPGNRRSTSDGDVSCPSPEQPVHRLGGSRIVPALRPPPTSSPTVPELLGWARRSPEYSNQAVFADCIKEKDAGMSFFRGKI